MPGGSLSVITESNKWRRLRWWWWLSKKRRRRDASSPLPPSLQFSSLSGSNDDKVFPFTELSAPTSCHSHVRQLNDWMSFHPLASMERSLFSPSEHSAARAFFVSFSFFAALARRGKFPPLLAPQILAQPWWRWRRGKTATYTSHGYEEKWIISPPPNWWKAAKAITIIKSPGEGRRRGVSPLGAGSNYLALNCVSKVLSKYRLMIWSCCVKSVTPLVQRVLVVEAVARVDWTSC